MNDEQLQALLNNLQVLANKLSMGGGFIDAMIVMGGIQAIRTLRTQQQAANGPVPELEKMLGEGEPIGACSPTCELPAGHKGPHSLPKRDAGANP